MSEDVSAEIQGHINAANHAEMLGDHNTRAAQATQALAKWAAAYHQTPTADVQNAAQASARLDALSRSPEWRSRYFANDPTAVQEFRELTGKLAATDDVERAMTGAGRSGFESESGSGDQAALRDQIAFVQEARDAGIPDENIRIMLGRTVGDKEGVRWAQQQIETRFRNPEWVARLSQRDPAVRREFIELAALANPTEIV